VSILHALPPSRRDLTCCWPTTVALAFRTPQARKCITRREPDFFTTFFPQRLRNVSFKARRREVWRRCADVGGGRDHSERGIPIQRASIIPTRMPGLPARPFGLCVGAGLRLNPFRTRHNRATVVALPRSMTGGRKGREAGQAAVTIVVFDSTTRDRWSAADRRAQHPGIAPAHFGPRNSSRRTSMSVVRSRATAQLA
jgi:hypothetical protein